MIPLPLVAAIEKILEKQIAAKGRIDKSEILTGGSINTCCKLNYANRDIFVKWNSSTAFPGMFVAEAKGLKLLSQHDNIGTPNIIGLGEASNLSFIMLSFINDGNKNHAFWNLFGTQLAALHQNSSNYFGLDHHNYIGSLPQNNTQYGEWISFFIEMRLEPQLRYARSHNNIDGATSAAFGKLFNKLDRYFPVEPPALLHGDLWSGNFLCNEHGHPILIDPAVYYGHREMDLAMTKLFGGFSNTFYEAYERAFPLDKQWKERIDLCNLYPLMVHVNLFGGAYVSQVKSVLKYFVG